MKTAERLGWPLQSINSLRNALKEKVKATDEVRYSEYGKPRTVWGLA